MKQAGQYIASFCVLMCLWSVVVFFGGGAYLKLLPPIVYLVMFAGGILRVFAGTVLLGIEVLLHYRDRSAYLESHGHYETRLHGFLEAKLANACVVAASILASTQTRTWIFCVYAVAVFALLGIGDEALKKIKPPTRESS